MELPPEVTKYGFLIFGLVMVFALYVIGLRMGTAPQDLIALAGVMVAIIGYGVVKEAAIAAAQTARR